MLKNALLALFVGVLAATPSGAAPAPQEEKPIRALLVLGGCCHDYEKQKDIITKGISERANVEWAIAYDPDKGTKHKNPVYDNPEWYKGFDVIVHDECCSDVKDADVISGVLKPHKDGLPAVLLHCGMHCYRGDGYPKETAWFEFTGLHTNGHGPQLPIEVTFTDKDHPILKGAENWTTVNEELYNNIIGKLNDTAKELARGKQVVKAKDGKENPVETIVAWTNTYCGKTRVFGTTLGHNNATVADARYLNMITRGLLWSVGKLDEAHLKPAKQVLLER
jgi:type 1 glutamine amidotransferase